MITKLRNYIADQLIALALRIRPTAARVRTKGGPGPWKPGK